MPTQYTGPACPEDCSEFDMPAVVSEYCLDTVVSELGEIKRILVVSTDADGDAVAKPTDYTAKADWEAVMHNTTADKIRSLWGIGSIPEPEKITRVFFDNQTKVTDRKYLMDFDVLSMAQVNYDAMRALQCGGSLRLWFITRGNFLYGGPGGIYVNINDADSIFERGADAYKKIVFKFEWNSLYAPPRIASPFETVAP